MICGKVNLWQAEKSPNVYSMLTGRESVCNLDELQIEREFLESFGCKKVKTSTQRGYVPTSLYAILNYAGKYGVGYVICTHSYKSNNLYNIEYWVM